MEQNLYNLRAGDKLSGDTITVVGEKTCQFIKPDQKTYRKTWKTINTTIGLNSYLLQTLFNPDIPVDFTTKEEVLKYYDSFNRWGMSFSGMDYSGFERLHIEVKDNMVLHNGEYYLYLPFTREKDILDDGLYVVDVIKKSATFYEHMAKNKINVFKMIAKIVPEDLQELINRSHGVFNRLEHKEKIAHIKSLNLSKVNLHELNFIEQNFAEIFDEFLPCKVTDKIYISKSPFKTTLNTNRESFLKIDSHGRGTQWNKLDYSVAIKVCPLYSNEAQYHKSVVINSVSSQSLSMGGNLAQESMNMFFGKNS